jgi:uncharacterized membrane protein (UPF0127 family)
MKIVRDFRPCWILGALLAAGCSGGERFEPQPYSGQIVEIEVGGKKIHAELAIDFESRRKGLMFRETLPPDGGMLFIWPEHVREDRYDTEGGLQKRSIWMKNTSIPLSLAFLSDDGKILQIEDLRPHDEGTVWSKDEVRFALEMNQGWFQVNGIAPGTVIQDFAKKVGGIRAR